MRKIYTFPARDAGEANVASGGPGLPRPGERQGSAGSLGRVDPLNREVAYVRSFSWPLSVSSWVGVRAPLGPHIRPPTSGFTNIPAPPPLVGVVGDLKSHVYGIVLGLVGGGRVCMTFRWLGVIATWSAGVVTVLFVNIPEVL